MDLLETPLEVRRKLLLMEPTFLEKENKPWLNFQVQTLPNLFMLVILDLLLSVPFWQIFMRLMVGMFKGGITWEIGGNSLVSHGERERVRKVRG